MPEIDRKGRLSESRPFSICFVSPVSAYGTDLRLCIKEDLGFV